MSKISKRLLNGWSELHVAADAGDLARVRQAVQKSPSDLNRTNKHRQTALHLAAARGYETVMNELLDRQVTATLQDEDGCTALHLAATAGHSRCVAGLLGSRNRDPPNEKARLLALRDYQGRDALMVAVMAGREDAVEELLRAGADAARCEDNSGTGVLLAAVQHEQVELLPRLVRACGGPDMQRDPFGGTALHAAAGRGNLRALECLLRLGASTTTRDNKGRTASEAALAAGQHAAVRALRDALPSSSNHNSNSNPGPVPGPGPVPPSPLAGQQPQPSPWGTLPWPPPGPGAPGAAAPAEGRGRGPIVRMIPDTAPPPVYYPTPPAGAPVYY